MHGRPCMVLFIFALQSPAGMKLQSTCSTDLPVMARRKQLHRVKCINGLSLSWQDSRCRRHDK